MSWIRGYNDLPNIDDFQPLGYFLWNILDVLAVVIRQQHGLDTGAVSTNQLLLDAANGHDPTTQRDLAGHSDLRRDWLVGEQGDQCNSVGQTSGRPVLGNGT